MKVKEESEKSKKLRLWQIDGEKMETVAELTFLNCGVLEKTLESPLDSQEIQTVNPKGNQP